MLASLLPTQTRFLQAVQSTGACTDASLAARLSDLGDPCDRSTLTRWRAGDRQAPLGLIRPLLVHLGSPQAAASVLRVLADGLGVEISVAAEPQVPCMTDAASGLQMAMAQVNMAILQATAATSPGGQRIDRSEAAGIGEQLDELESRLQELRKATEAACL